MKLIFFVLIIITTEYNWNLLLWKFYIFKHRTPGMLNNQKIQWNWKKIPIKMQFVILVLWYFICMKIDHNLHPQSQSNHHYRKKKLIQLHQHIYSKNTSLDQTIFNYYSKFWTKQFIITIVNSTFQTIQWTSQNIEKLFTSKTCSHHFHTITDHHSISLLYLFTTYLFTTNLGN